MIPAEDENHRLILEARKVLHAVAPSVIWRRTVKSYQAGFGPHSVRVELTKELRLRVVNIKTGEVIEAPAFGPWAP